MAKTVVDSVQEMLAQIGGVTKDAKAVQGDARSLAFFAIRALERVLVAQLAGNAIRGLKNIGLGEAPFYGARVRGDTCDGRMRWPDAPNSLSETLIIAPSGRLEIAICRTDVENSWLGAVETRAATDAELQIEDLERMLRVYAEIIPRHIAYSARARERYTGLRDLSDKVLRLLGDEVR